LVSAKSVVVVVVIAAVALAFAILAPISTPPSGNAPSGPSQGNCKPPEGYTAIIENNSGINGSIAHGAPKNPWPVITVHKGDTVRLFICNLDRIEAHGFAIDGYFDGGVTLRPGDTYRLTFTADKTGSFVIFCNVFCTVHIFMRGTLVVTG